MAFLWAMMLLLAGAEAAELERDALRSTGSTIVMLAMMVAVWIAVRRAVVSLARNDEQDVQYEEVPPAAVQGLGLYRDGVLAVVSPASRDDR